jgi:hypothetical protein
MMYKIRRVFLRLGCCQCTGFSIILWQDKCKPSNKWVIDGFNMWLNPNDAQWGLTPAQAFGSASVQAPEGEGKRYGE